jgi:Ca-activated chloride channel family protein
MQIPLIDEEQFQQLAALGGVREVMRDGIPVWNFDQVPPGFFEQCLRPLDYVQQAARAAVETLRRQDQCSLIAFANSARQLSPLLPAMHRAELLTAIDGLESTSLGDDTRLASGLALAAEALGGSNSNGDGKVRRILLLTDGFAADVEEAMDMAEKAVQAGISISTMGLGAEFNDALLVALADTSGGNAYLVKDAADIPELFAQELSASQSIVLRDLEIKLHCSGDVRLRRAFRIKPVISEIRDPLVSDKAFSLSLGDLNPQAPPVVLLELVVPPHQPGRYRLAQAMLAHVDARGLPGPKALVDLVVEVGTDPSEAPPVDPSVMNVVETATAFNLQTQALADAQRGDLGSATAKLRAAATRLLNLGETGLAKATLEEAERLQQEGRISAAGTKKLRYETRRLTRETTGT